MLSLLFLSCRRIPLLERTLDAARQHFQHVEKDLKPQFICFDNGSCEIDQEALKNMGFDFLFLSKQNLGIGPAMNQLVSSVRTPYFLNMQDDWHLENPMKHSFVSECLRIMECDNRILQVKLDACHFLDFDNRAEYAGPFKAPGASLGYYVRNPERMWGGFTFPPAISRTSAVRSLGPFEEKEPFRRGWAESEYSARSARKFVTAKSPELLLFKHIGETPTTGWHDSHTSGIRIESNRGSAPDVDLILPSIVSKPTKSSISCLLTAFRRPGSLRRQWEAVSNQSVRPRQVALWKNSGDGCDFDQGVIGRIPNIQSTNSNWGVWPRFLFCMEFDTEFVCVFDDDTIPGPRWLENCLDTMRQREGLLGALGVSFLDGSRARQFKTGWCNPINSIVEVDVVGHAWFFMRDWLRHYAVEPRRGFATCGEDYHFSVALQKHLGLGTYVPPHDPQSKECWGSIAGETGSDEVALYLKPGESEKKGAVHQAYLDAGWKPLCTRQPGHSQVMATLSQQTEITIRLNPLPPNTGQISSVPKRPAEVTKSSVENLCFTHDFQEDFKKIDLKRHPFALARFGDGEMAICSGRAVKVSDGWSFGGGENQFSSLLNQALRADLEGFHIGISCRCCDAKGNAWYRANVQAPEERWTFANIFANGNYDAFLKLDLANTALVSCRGGDVSVPQHAIHDNLDLDEILCQLFALDRPILVAAGPLSCILIHQYWLRAPRKQVIIDIGSSLDPILHGRPTRAYHREEHVNRRKVCIW